MGACFLIPLMLITSADVLTRDLFNHPIPGTIEVFVDDVQTTNFTYNESTHIVKLGFIPAMDSNIRITYQLQK